MKKSFPLFIFVFLAGMLAGCLLWERSASSYKGFELEEFSVDEDSLAAICDDFSKFYQDSRESDDAAILQIEKQDSCTLFNFAKVGKGNVIESHVFGELDGLRIIGFIQREKTEIIMLSNIRDEWDFITLYGRLFHPSGKTMRFDYLEYPSDRFGSCYNRPIRQKVG